MMIFGGDSFLVLYGLLDLSIPFVAADSYLSVEGLKCLCNTHGVHRVFVCCFLMKYK